LFWVRKIFCEKAYERLYLALFAVHTSKKKDFVKKCENLWIHGNSREKVWIFFVNSREFTWNHVKKCEKVWILVNSREKVWIWQHCIQRKKLFQKCPVFLLSNNLRKFRGKSWVERFLIYSEKKLEFLFWINRKNVEKKFFSSKKNRWKCFLVLR
jgi:hypothetical protein